MMSITVILAIAGIVLYLASAGRILLSLRNPDTAAAASISDKLPILAVIAAGLHALYIAITFVADHGISTDLYDALSLTAIVIVATILIAAIKMPIRNLLPLPLIIAAASLALSGLGSDAAPVTDTARTGLLVHIISSIIGYSFISLAALSAIALHWQQSQLKRHRTGFALQTLPPLQTMESLLFQLIHYGFCFVSLAIVTGFIFVDDLFQQHLAHKTVFTVLSWGIFAVLLIGRHLRGWRGPTAIRWTLIGFAALLLGYFGSKFVLQVILHRS